MSGIRRLGLGYLVGLGAIASISLITSQAPAIAQVDVGTQASPLVAQSSTPASIPAVWQMATPEEEQQTWSYILNSPLGIAALNQLAIEGFISPACEKTFYTHQEYNGFQTLLQVKCPGSGGISSARSYSEIRVVFNRFEDSIENFSVERIYDEN